MTCATHHSVTRRSGWHSGSGTKVRTCLLLDEVNAAGDPVGLRDVDEENKAADAAAEQPARTRPTHQTTCVPISHLLVKLGGSDKDTA